MCQGRAEIIRPKKVTRKTICRRWYDADDVLRENQVEVMTLHGGADACLSCARQAEEEWRETHDN
jgi:hypothetical protein